MAAEIVAAEAERVPICRFNEAAANGRGNRIIQVPAAGAGPALQ